MAPSSEASRTPEQLIRLYWDEVWNNCNVELIREICADPIIRHDPGGVTALSHDEQVARVRQQSETRRPCFTHEVLVADADHVTSVWNMTTRKGDPIALCGIEVFRAENGRLTHAWNSPYVIGAWGREGDLSVPADLAPPEIIDRPGSIDRDWLQRMFAGSGVAVPRVGLVVAVTPVGHDKTSRIFRVEVAYNADASAAPATLICKLMPQAPAGAERAAFRREVESYRFFGAKPGFRLPRAYMAQISGDGAAATLVLDIGNGARSARLTGCDRAAAAAVVEQLGRLHTAYWHDPQLDTQAWLMDRASMGAAADAAYRAGMAELRDRLGNRLALADIATIDAFAPHVHAWTACQPDHRTIVHGDPRLDNVIFEALADGTLRACLIGWQTAGIGDPTFDLACFLTSSLAPEDRRAGERDLLAQHTAMIAAADPAYDGAAAQTGYRRNIVAGLNATVNSAVGIEKSAENDELLVTLVRRNCAAVTDWGGIAAVVGSFTAIAERE